MELNKKKETKNRNESDYFLKKAMKVSKIHLIVTYLKS